ncbi:MAG: S8 family serine peptidase [Nitrospinae bacterium]|nr:S8 family serine peptidase [Nitrospinota bacterium]
MTSYKNAWIGLCLGLVLGYHGLAWGQNENSTSNPTRNAVEDAAGSFIFVFDPAQVAASEVPGKARGLVDQHGGTLRFQFSTALRGFSAAMSAQAAERLAARTPELLYYEKNGVVWAIGKPVQPSKKPTDSPGKKKPGGGTTTEPPQTTPAGITRVGGPLDGTGRNAWVIDTGIDPSHPDLNVGSGANFVLRGKDSTKDGNGHGTHVAGTIAAIDNTIDVVGVAAGATVHPIRVLNNSGSGTVDGVIAGIDFVAANAQPGDCANMSLSASGHFESLHNAVTNAADRGILFSIAAGNNASHAGNYEPAHVEHNNVYTVSAIDDQDVFASFSNFGNPPVDYAAPGVSVLSTQKGGGVTTLSGTSMAAPHVCGLLVMDGGILFYDGVAIDDPDGSADQIAHH